MIGATPRRVARRACALLGVLAGASLGATPSDYAPTAVGAAGSVTPIGHWQIQSSAKAPATGATIASAGFSTQEWYAVSGRATVVAGLLENHVFQDLFYADNLRTVEEPDASGTPFVIPWWYRAEFTVPAQAPGAHTLIRINGLIPGADLWLNGQAVSERGAIAGAYPVTEFDVTGSVHTGTNVLALQVHPGDPRTDLSIGWVDWNPAPPDNNMGPWRGVDVLQTGAIQLHDVQVNADLSLPTLERAAITVRVQARNLDTTAHEAMLAGEVAGVALRRAIHLDPGQRVSITFSPQSDAGLALSRPRIWWPNGMGDQPLYRAQFSVSVDGAVSDRTDTSFGIRTVSSHLTPEGYRQFVVNGKPVLIRGAGWASDMFLRDDPERLDSEFSYVRDLGLNTIRLEGNLENARFYELADRNGIMVLPGWECCDKWESAAKTGGEPWSAADEIVAVNSMASEARLLRNHPSVIGFLIGSDNAPPPALAKRYVDALQAEGWSLPIIAAAIDQGTAQTGPAGLKMAGPYSWVPPAYWYADKLGGAFGFDSEVSAGASIPLLEDLVRMLSPEERDALWRTPEARQYHASAAWSVFANIAPFDQALAARYGAPRNLEDYVAKAQLDNYENVRAQFEAFNAHRSAANPATGVIYWMLNNAWPSLHWHLYDYFLNPAGAYFGAKLANEPLHIQYAYDTRTVMLVNQTLSPARALHALVRVRNLDGHVAYERRLQGIDLHENGSQPLLVLPTLTGLTRTYFLELELTGARGEPISRNVYWLSTEPDVLDWAQSNWYLTPSTHHADFTDLQTLPAVSSDVRASIRQEGREQVATIVLTMPPASNGFALFQHLSIRQSTGAAPVLPIRWSENEVTLWPGESRTVTARFAAPATAPVLEVSGWNTPPQRVPLAAQGAH